MACMKMCIPVDPSHKSHYASDKYPRMHHFVTEMCTHVHISVTKWCIVGHGTGALWDLCNRSIKMMGVITNPCLNLPYTLLVKWSNGSQLGKHSLHTCKWAASVLVVLHFWCWFHVDFFSVIQCNYYRFKNYHHRLKLTLIKQRLRNWTMM